MTTFAYHKRAKSDYKILETYEAGLKLTGAEVKSTKAGGLKLDGAYVTIAGGILKLLNAHIAAYKPAGAQPDYDPNRSRPLLVTKRERNEILGRMQQKGLTLVPLRAYSKRNLIKLEFAIGQGRKKFEKRDVLKKREADRTMRRALNQRR